MATYIALLRGINVGGRTIKMVDLKDCLEKAGFANVQTILQTGNVILESSGNPESTLEKVVAEKFYYDAKILVLSQADMESAIKKYPFNKTDEKFQHYVIFLRPGLAADLAKQEVDQSIEEVKAGKGLVYWKVQKGMTLKSTFSKHLTKAKFKDGNTVRNIKTLEKILTKT